MSAQPNMPVKQELQTVSEGNAIIQVIERAASNPAIDVEKMERLLAMQERILARNAESEFSSAMSRAQAALGRVSADATNPQTHSKYASYAALDRVLRPVYTEAGFSLSFGTENTPLADHLRVICYVSHLAGHTRKYHIDMPADGKGAKGGDVMTKTHATGSAMSYGTRYLLKAIFNVAIGADDDDGNRSGARPKITAEQAADVQALADEVKANVPAFLKYLAKAGKVQIGTIQEIPANMLKDAVAALERKRLD